MAARKFKDLVEPIKADPERAARIARHRAETIAEIVDYTLGELRRARKITQDELARLMATTQPNVSRIEKGGEMELSTLRTYVEALGGRLEVTAVFDDERFPVTVGGMSRSRRRRLPTGNRGRTGRVGGAASVPQ
jgi:DNA-binding transcriptional regulator YiaG